MAEILSQSEIDALLKALSEGEIDAETVKKEEKKKSVKPYDFRRPNKFAKDQMRTLVMLHENFSRRLGTSLSAYLRTMVQMEVASVDQMTYEEFTRSLTNPTVINILSVGPLEGNIILEFTPNLAFAIIDRLLGGSGGGDYGVRELTEIEQRVIRQVVTRFFPSISEAWSNVVAMEPGYVEMETNPLFTQFIPPSDMVILVTMHLKITETSGLMNLCYPYTVLEPLLPRLSAQSWFGSSRKNFTQEAFETLKDRLKEAVIPVKVELGTASISIRELLNLSKGDAIKLDQGINTPLTVRIGEETKYVGFPGLSKNNRVAVQLSGYQSKGGEESVQ
ncbi:MAG: flagellar motor switch protein FliM [Firmicutes bacterium]|nr:flagellar motor switch protein FliM [Bacillota bacterium]